MKKIIQTVALALTVTLLAGTSADASSISDLTKKKNATQSELNDVNDTIDDLKDQQSEAQSELNELDSELVDLLSDIDILEGDLDAKEEEIAQAQEDYDAAKAQEDTQYDNMKKRIKFMYEQGDTSYVELLLESQSITDWLNKADYATQVYDYDRDMLTQYAETKQQVQDLQDQLDEDQQELLEIEEDLNDQKANLETLIEEKKKTVANFETQLAAAKKKAASLTATLKTQTAALKKAQAAAAAKKSSSSGGVTLGSGAGSATGNSIASYACQFVGNPYVWGGTSLTNGADCSGFTMAVFAHFGISLPHSSGAQASCGRAVSYSEAQAGDLICYPGHVAIYLGGGRIVHASTAATGIKYGTATYRTIKAIRRCY